MHYPQTNLALYQDLTQRGFGDDDLARVHRGYHLAVRLFANRFRADGRPFVTHLVGTAAVIAAHGPDDGARIDSVLAGLLHAAYAQGEFGDRLPRAHESHRARLAAAIGAEAEALTFAYDEYPWPPDDPTPIVERIGSGGADDTERRVLALRAANEYDDVRDLAPLYYGGSKTAVVDAGCAAAVAIAGALGLDDLARVLNEAVERNRDATVPDALRSSRSRSYVVDPVRLRERLRRAVFKR